MGQGEKQGKLPNQSSQLRASQVRKSLVRRIEEKVQNAAKNLASDRT